MITSRRLESISNENMEFSFDKSNGKLVNIRNLVTGNEYLNGSIKSGSPFAVYYDFIRDYEITCDKNGTPWKGADPAAISDNIFSPTESTSVNFKRINTPKTNSLKVTYIDTQGDWRVELTVKLKPAGSISSVWSIKLTNIGPSPASFMMVFPFISGLKLGDGKRNLMIANDQAGCSVPLWSKRGGIYGNSTQMSMQWGCIFNNKNKDVFGFIVKDPNLINKEITYIKPNIEVRYFPPQTVNPGETITFPDTEITIYTGNWKKTAVAYHDWFSGVFKPVKHPEWVKQMDGYAGQWTKNRKQNYFPEDSTTPWPGYAYTMDSFTELPDVYRRLSIDTMEFSFFCRGSMGKALTGKFLAHTDGDNIVREDLGGVSALKKGIDLVHKLGFHTTFYIEGLLCPGYSDIAVRGKAREWAYMNKDGTNQGVHSFNKNPWLCMCPGAKRWQDHLAQTAARLVRETGADGVRLDSLGCYFFPCYNPLHKHKSPFDFNVWMCELLEKVSASVRKENPNCLLMTEAPVDFYSQHFNGSLTQQWSTALVSIIRDLPPMRVALPEYFVTVHSPCGPVVASLTGYPGGCGGQEMEKKFLELDKKWRSARFAVNDIIRWGNAATENPIASRSDVVCRRFNAHGLDVIVGARLYFQTDFGKCPADNPSNLKDVDVKKDRVSFQVRINNVGNPPERVYVYDIEKLCVEETAFKVDENKIIITVKSNWFMLILMYGKIIPFAIFDIPMVLSSGKTYDMHLSLLGETSIKRFEGWLYAPGIGWSKAAGKGLKVNIPGTVKLTVPTALPQGKYPIKLYGNQFLGCKRFIEIK